jgi:epoxyqueuosine reductase
MVTAPSGTVPPSEPLIALSPQIRKILAQHGLDHMAALTPDFYSLEVNGSTSSNLWSQAPLPPGSGDPGNIDFTSSASARWRRHILALKTWVKAGFHGTMSYLERNEQVRSDPRMLMPNVASIFVFLIPYGTGHRVRSRASQPTSVSGHDKEPPDAYETHMHGRIGYRDTPLLARIARYARYRDYHKVIKARLSRAFEDMHQQLSKSSQFLDEEEDQFQHLPFNSGEEFQFRVVVDSVPFLDRAHANMAGLGFVGKNTMLIRPGLGSYFFIASVLTNLDPKQIAGKRSAQNPKSPLRIHSLNCGTCNRCVEACPTQAINGDYTLDASRCFSFWSIESRDATPDAFLPAYQNLSFGCDICQDVCPYNFVTNETKRWKEFEEPDPRLSDPDVTLRFLSTLSLAEYERVFGGLPLTRAKREGLVRNALYGLLETGDFEGVRLAAEHWSRQADCPDLIVTVLLQIKSRYPST